MAEKTAIKWTDATFNIVWGCEKVSPACANCYAESLATRWGFDVWGKNKPRRTFGEKHWREPLKWNAQAEREGVRRRVFCSSMADVFEDHPTVDAEREKLWPLIRETPWLDWQLLTKRAERIAGCLPADWGRGWPNVWLGVTAENQEWAEERIPHLIKVPAVVRFVSAEPLLGPIDFYYIFGGNNTPLPCEGQCSVGMCNWPGCIGDVLHWVIVGGESGAKHRPLDLEDARDLREQCRVMGVSYFFKQVGGLRPNSGGDLLDGKRHHEMPRTAAPPPSN